MGNQKRQLFVPGSPKFTQSVSFPSAFRQLSVSFPSAFRQLFVLPVSAYPLVSESLNLFPRARRLADNPAQPQAQPNARPTRASSLAGLPGGKVKLFHVSMFNRKETIVKLSSL